MNDLTFLMPCRIESEDRLRNVITSVSYLSYNFPQSKILVKESDSQSVFQRDVLPAIQNIFGSIPQNLNHIFEKTDNKFFYKTRILNDLLLESTTSIVYNYDVDVVYPISSYETAYHLIENNQLDVVYPYGCGVYQYAVDYPISTFEAFVESEFDLRILHPNCRLQPSVMGWGQMIKRQVYIDSYMWNENFISWGAEDCEYYYRLQALGYKVGRVNNIVYHLEHSRTFNSHYHNPKFMDNHNLWQNIRTWNENMIVKYYESQNYVSERRKQLNAGV
jgi:hypothetical protein